MCKKLWKLGLLLPCLHTGCFLGESRGRLGFLGLLGGVVPLLSKVGFKRKYFWESSTVREKPESKSSYSSQFVALGTHPKLLPLPSLDPMVQKTRMTLGWDCLLKSPSKPNLSISPVVSLRRNQVS